MVGKAKSNLSPSVIAAEDTTTRTPASASNFIRAWRLFRGFERQEDLCALVDFNRSVLSRLENGTLQYRQWHLDMLAPVLNCACGDLISNDPNSMADVFKIYEALPAEKRAKALKVMRNLSR